MKFRNLILALWITAIGWTATKPVAVYQAEVTADHVNVRARPSLRAEIIGQLNRGEQVKVIGEILTLKKQEKKPQILWRLIQLPSRFQVWVYASYVDPATGEVKASKLNVRCGPSFLHAVVGRVPKGTRLKILGRQGAWLRIRPPQGTYGYVYGSYLRPLEGETLPAAPPPEKIFSPNTKPKLHKTQTTSPKEKTRASQKAAQKPEKQKPKKQEKKPEVTRKHPKPQPAASSSSHPRRKSNVSAKSDHSSPKKNSSTSPGKRKTADTGQIASASAKKTPHSSKPILIPPVPPQVSKPIPVPSSSVSPPARQRGKVSKWKKASGPALVAAAGSHIQRASSSRSGSAVKPQVRPSGSVKPIPVGPYASYVPGQARYVYREGIVKYTLSPKAPGAYQLVDSDTGDRLAFLYPGKPSIRIAPFHKQRVIVEGDEYRDPRWPHDTVIFVRRIRLAP